MKKIFSTLLAVTMIFAMETTAFAADRSTEQNTNADFCINGVGVTVSYENDDISQMMSLDIDTVSEQTAKVARTTTTDLGTSGSINLTWSVTSESTIRSEYNYKTNSEKMVVKMKADEQSTSVTLRCYDINGTVIFSKSATVGTNFNTTFTITGLTYSNTYYFELSNNDQHKEHFTGTISAK